MEDLSGWVSKAQGGDEAAYRELFRACRPAVVRLLRGFPLDPDEIEDLVQESFARAFRGLPRLKASAAFAPWLLTIARNRALTAMSRKSVGEKFKTELEHEAPVSAAMHPESFHQEVDVAVVRELIEQMPEGSEKETVVLFYVEGELSAREIAERQGVGKSAITMRLERFRARIKRELLARLVRARWD